MISKIALLFASIIAVLATAAATFSDAQATVLTSLGVGGTTAVAGIPISVAQFNNVTTWGKFAPYAYTSQEIALSTGDMVLVMSNDQTALAFQYNVIWNFTANEAALIRTFLSSVYFRNNVLVSFTATWDSTGRFNVNTSTWTFPQQSLLPYGMTTQCNLSALVIGERATLSLLPNSCATVMVPAQKNLAIAMPYCLTYLARKALTIDNACQTVRAFLETVYCTDGSTGVDAVCTYNHDFLPSGINGPTVLTVDANGFATAGLAGTPPAPTTSLAPPSVGPVDLPLIVLNAGANYSVTAMLTTQSFYATLKGQYYPFMSSTAELSTESKTSNIILVTRNAGSMSSTKYVRRWNFTTSETALIKPYLDALAIRNNIEVSFTATWDSTGRFAINTSSWILAQGSIMPYGVTSSCDVVKMATCLIQLEHSFPINCQNTMISLLKSCAVAQPECLGIYGKTLHWVHFYCVYKRSTMDAYMCTDGSAGGDAACAFVGIARPNGIALASPVVTVDANGFATAGFAGTAPATAISAAGAITSMTILSVMIAITAVVAF